MKNLIFGLLGIAFLFEVVYFNIAFDLLLLGLVFTTASLILFKIKKDTRICISMLITDILSNTKLISHDGKPTRIYSYKLFSQIDLKLHDIKFPYLSEPKK